MIMIFGQFENPYNISTYYIHISSLHYNWVPYEFDNESSIDPTKLASSD